MNGSICARDVKVVWTYLTSQTLMSSGIKTGHINVDDQAEKIPRFSKKKTGFYSRKTLDATKLGGKSIKVCKTTKPPTCKHGGDFA